MAATRLAANANATGDGLLADWTEAMRGGDYARAWAIDHSILVGRDPDTRDDPRLPLHRRWVWDGRSFAATDVLVRCYHGLGDTIQFARYLPALREIARSVTLEVQPHLLPLFERLAGVDRLLPFDHRRTGPPHEREIEIMELAFALRQPPEATRAPYLHMAPAPLPSGTIGLCWAAGAWDDARSIPPETLGPLRARSCITLVTAPTRLSVLNPEGCPANMLQTASLIAGSALVVTVDTMVAHLAGALGRPTWLLLKHEPDWRWPVEGERTPWYPSMRIYRQRRPGDWGEVVARVARDLELFEAADRRSDVVAVR